MLRKIYLRVTIVAALILSVGSLAYFTLPHRVQSPDNIAKMRKSIEGLEKPSTGIFLIGTTDGIYKVTHNIEKVYSGEVKKILPTPSGIWALTKNDLLFSEDGKNFQSRSLGIRQKFIKAVDGTNVSLIKENELLKDIAVDPNNPHNLITASVNGVYITQDQGKSWHYIPSHSVANGIKSVGIFSWNGRIMMLFGHPYKGLYYKYLEDKHWEILSGGMSSQGEFRNEISSIAVVSRNDKSFPTVFVSQNFDPVAFRVDFQTKRFIPLFSPKKLKSVQLMESLQLTQTGNFLYVQNNGVQVYNPREKSVHPWPKIQDFLLEFRKSNKTFVNTIAAVYEGHPLYSLSELWMLNPPLFSARQKLASHKKGIYVQADVLRSPKRLESLLALCHQLHLNMIVVDMKDDFGYLRFSPSSPLLKAGGVVQNPIDLPKISPLLKKNHIYVVARVPVFKDAVLYKYKKGEWAVQDSSTKKPWRGLKKSKGKLVLTKEYWVDPYNENVWKYNVVIAKELTKQGIDEIQFDYIRFPTDGTNLKFASYPSQREGMDKESALISFLRFVRKEISLPISVDIYGANGWIRTGARTGQDVELLSQYTDVIAPMYYPSHFGNSFLNYPPYPERPYRIYNLGAYRNDYIARGKSVIRPYVQAFELVKNRYDAQYYGPAYINGEILGIRDSINLGFTFWNSSTKYSILYNTVLNKSNKQAHNG